MLGERFHNTLLSVSRGDGCSECDPLRGERASDDRTKCEVAFGYFEAPGGHTLSCQDWPASQGSYGYPVSSWLSTYEQFYNVPFPTLNAAMEEAQDAAAVRFGWTCPGSIRSVQNMEYEVVPVSADAANGMSSMEALELPGRYAPIYPGPGYWMRPGQSAPVILKEEHLVEVEQHDLLSIIPELNCQNTPKGEEICVGTSVDRDWEPARDHLNRTLTGLQYAGYCNGEKKEAATQQECGNVSVPADGCIQPPFFCRLHHESIFCATCAEGTYKLASGHCCVPSEESLQLSDLIGIVMPALLAAWLFRSAILVKASDTIVTTFTFFLQVMKLVGFEKDWASGLPFIRELMEVLTGIADLDYPPIRKDGPCDPITCSYWGGDGGVIGSFYSTALLQPIYMAICMYGALRLARHRSVIAWTRKLTCGFLCKDDSDGATRYEDRVDSSALFTRSLIAVYNFAFMPATLSAMRILIARRYNDFEHPLDDSYPAAEGVGHPHPLGDPQPSALESEPEPATMTVSNHGELDPPADGPLWLLEADPSIVFFGTWKHAFAYCLALAVLVVQLVVLPALCFHGAAKETEKSSETYLKLQAGWARAADAAGHLKRLRKIGRKKAHDQLKQAEDALDQSVDLDESAEQSTAERLKVASANAKTVDEKKARMEVYRTTRSEIAALGDTPDAKKWIRDLTKDVTDAMKTITNELEKRELAVELAELRAMLLDLSRPPSSGGGGGGGTEITELPDDQALRTQVVSAKDLKFSLLYAKVSPVSGLQGWWWMVDLTKKFAINAVYLQGRSDATSLWKFYAFIIVATTMFVSEAAQPSPAHPIPPQLTQLNSTHASEPMPAYEWPY
jgi:hypothetical protein